MYYCIIATSYIGTRSTLLRMYSLKRFMGTLFACFKKGSFSRGFFEGCMQAESSAARGRSQHLQTVRGGLRRFALHGPAACTSCMQSNCVSCLSGFTKTHRGSSSSQRPRAECPRSLLPPIGASDPQLQTLKQTGAGGAVHPEQQTRAAAAAASQAAVVAGCLQGSRAEGLSALGL